MPNFGYSITGFDKDKTAVASGRDIKVSPKGAREVTKTIKGMNVEQAKRFLESVIFMRQPVPFKRHNKKVAHRHGLSGRFKWASGRFPEKSARVVYEVLSNAEANAEYKGLDTERCRIIHAAVMKGRSIKRYIERAHGRSSPYFDTLTHIEIVLLEE